ncbi:MAG: hypothetical protein II600_00990, partial [Bacteroidaceae bacterium]|nr:hypothetical protein [Bacteroidaceae bacterium]
AKLLLADNQEKEKWRMPSAKLEKWCTPPDRLFNRLNYSNLLLLSKIDNATKRAFYEQETANHKASLRGPHVLPYIKQPPK